MVSTAWGLSQMQHPRPCQPRPTVTATCDNIPGDSYEKRYSRQWDSIRPVLCCEDTALGPEELPEGGAEARWEGERGHLSLEPPPTSGTAQGGLASAPPPSMPSGALALGF